jgi:hypothetical protein
MPRNRTKHVKQAKGGGRRKSGGPISDKIKSMQMKDASSGKQRIFNRSVDD